MTRKNWEIIVEEDPETGELILPFPKDFLETQNWKEGDELEWIDRGDGSWEIKKLDKK
jgi:bifunctional DNA-binding transcriptional regulator/antitoxin component of YhaV-PrlF toxin-antitoxin module